VLSRLGVVTAYARRRGSLDADALAADVMTIAWRRLAEVLDPEATLVPVLRGSSLALS
jgi:hypothetical protein